MVQVKHLQHKLISFTAYMWGVEKAVQQKVIVSGTGGNGGAGAYVTVRPNFQAQQAFGILVGQFCSQWCYNY